MWRAKMSTGFGRFCRWEWSHGSYVIGRHRPTWPSNRETLRGRPCLAARIRCGGPSPWWRGSSATLTGRGLVRPSGRRGGLPFRGALRRIRWRATFRRLCVQRRCSWSVPADAVEDEQCCGEDEQESGDGPREGDGRAGRVGVVAHWVPPGLVTPASTYA